MIKIIIAVASFVWALLLSAVALFLPPQGEIDQSVLLLVAQLLLLTATLLGVDSYVDRITRHGK